MLKLNPKNGTVVNPIEVNDSSVVVADASPALEAIAPAGNDNTADAASAGVALDEVEAIPGLVDTAPCGVDHIDPTKCRRTRSPTPLSPAIVITFATITTGNPGSVGRKKGAGRRQDWRRSGRRAPPCA